MVTPEKILQTINSWQSGEVIAVRRKKCSGASSRPSVQCPVMMTCVHIVETGGECSWSGSEYWRGETLTVTRPHSINITRYTRYDHMTDWQWMEWGGFLCRTFVMLVCNLHIVIFLLCLYQHCLISWNSTTSMFIKHNQFVVWCNHNIPELLISTFSITHHLWASFPFFNAHGQL